MAVDDAAAGGGGLWLSYLFVLFYLAVAAGAVTQQDLFFEHAVKLPFLGIELPLVAFFAVAPLIFLVVHAYTFVHFVFLTDKAKRYHQVLYDQIGDEAALSGAERAERKANRDGLRRQLPSNIFIQFLAGPSDLREGGFGWLLRTIAWFTLVVAPVLLMLMMQIQFLPYHSLAIVWTQRAALAADLVLIWWLWRRILSGQEEDGGRRSLAVSLWAPIGLLLSAAALLFSVAVATFPGEWQEDLPSWSILPAIDEWGTPAKTSDKGGQPGTESFRDWVANARRVSLHEWLFAEQPDISLRRFPFSSALFLPGLNVYEGLGVDDLEKTKGRDFLFRARGRDLRGAIFVQASLPKVDFGGAKLQGAMLQGAQLQGASLEFAQLQGATLDFAQLQGATLESAQLQGASLYSAQLQGATLYSAQLQGASLQRAQLQGASLENATLGATDLSSAFLWRTSGIPKSITNVQLLENWAAWLPISVQVFHTRRGLQFRKWDDKAYGDFRKTIEALPSGKLRDDALERIRALDCADESLGSCLRASPSPWWSENARADGSPYQTALAAELRTLVCSGGEDAIYVARGEGFRDRLKAGGAKAIKLIGDLANKDQKECPVAAALSDADRAKLLGVKLETAPAQESAPPDPAYSP